MTTLDPDLLPDAWDSAIIGTVGVLALCKVRKGSRKLKWDKKVAFGTDGPATKLTGVDATTFTMRVEFWEGMYGLTAAEQRVFWETDVLPQLKAAESGKAAIYFYHPAVSDPPVSCTAVVPEEIGQYEQEDSGLWYTEVQFLKFGKPKAAVGAPKAAKKGNEEPLDANQKKIAELTQELKNLANE